MNDVMVVGGGGHAKVVISLLKKVGYRVVGYTDRVDHGDILEIQFLGDDAMLPQIRHDNPHCSAVIGIGKIDHSDYRQQLQSKIVSFGFELPLIVSSGAIINEQASLGTGTVVCDGAIVNSGAMIGDICILNTNCTVEHDCRIGNNVHIAPGVTLSGGISIGDHTMVGVGATVIQSVSICSGCIIGAGSTVVRDITVPGTYVGSPAERIK